MATENEQQAVTAEPEKQPNPIRGYIDCPICAPQSSTVATVLESKRKRLYFKCPVHDVQLMTNNACQQWLHDNIRDTPQRQAGEPKQTPAPASVAKPAAKIEPAKTKSKNDPWENW